MSSRLWDAGLGQEAAQDTLASAIMYGSGNKVKDPCTPPAFESNIPTAVGLERTEPSEQGKIVSAVGNFTGSACVVAC